MRTTARDAGCKFHHQLIKFHVDFRLKISVEVNCACDDSAIKITAEFMNVVLSRIEHLSKHT
jgi:hypothetical protein